ncbi:MAG: hypothetical protein ACU841_13495 [Gammaproteobacteria bacterium]
MKTKTQAQLKLLAAGVLIGLFAVSGSAFAAKGGVPGKPPGAGGGGGEETASQSLSVPAILVGSLTLPNACGDTAATPSALAQPTGTPLTGYEIDPTAFWWVQKVHNWQAQCFKAANGTVDVFGAWGDNLTGDASLKTGSPIRVELVLTNTGDYTVEIPPVDPYTVPTLQGYDVKKLEPSKLDRESAYGHLAGGASPAWTNIPKDFLQSEWVVHDAGMQLSVEHLASGAYVVPLQAIKPEINATGKIVYGYNLRVNAAGTYQIRFNAPSVTFTGVDAGTYDDNNAYLDIVVGGGGGGRPPR